MYHSIDIITFPGRGSGSLKFNTYKDFYLVPTTIPVISPPAVKTKTIDIPGANGAIDLTESLTPYPVYKNRTGSLEFAVLNDRIEYYNRYRYAPHSMNPQHAIDGKHAWSILYSDLSNKLHGRKCRLILEDDPNWFYEGRIAINSWKSSNNGEWPIVTLDYDLAPYKLSIDDSFTAATETGTDRWKWDPFSFIDGIILSGATLPSGVTADGLWKNITLNSPSTYITYGAIVNNTVRMNRDYTGWMPVSPAVTIKKNSENMSIKIINPELGYEYVRDYPTNTSKDVTYIDPECILYDYLGNGYTLQIRGNGTMSIAFRKGSL